MSSPGVKQRYAIYLGMALLLVPLMPGCSGGIGAPMTIAGTWTLTVDPSECPFLAGFLTGTEVFVVQQDAAGNVTANFTDSGGNTVTVTGRLQGTQFGGTITVQEPGGAQRRLEIDADGVARTIDTMVMVEGSLRVLSDTAGTCTGAFVLFSAEVVPGNQVVPPPAPPPPPPIPPPPPPPPPILPRDNCGPVDIVVVMDTTTSMRSEALLFCDRLQNLATELSNLGATQIRVTLWGIREDARHVLEFSCLTNNVCDALGDDVPGSATTLPAEPELDSDEDWGGASAIVAKYFTWRPGADTFRFVMPFSDEGPEDGGPTCNLEDQIEIDNLVQVALENGVRVCPIIGDLGNQGNCVFNHAVSAAFGTGGMAIRASNAEFNDLVEFILDTACE